MQKVNIRLILRWGLVITIMMNCRIQAANQSEIEDLLQRKMNGLRELKSDPTANVHAAKKYGVELLPYLEQYRNDPCDNVRCEANELLMEVGKNSNLPATRQEIVYKVMEGLNDKSGLVLGSTLRGLISFNASDFHDMSKQVLHDKLSSLSAQAHANKDFLKGIILLAGVADMNSEAASLEKFLIDEKTVKPEGYWWRTVSWAARRARARMGVKEDIKRCIELVESQPDVTQRVCFLLQDLQYVRQPEVVDYLRKYLESKEIEPPLKAHVRIGRCREVRIEFCQYGAAALAEMLVGFPVKKVAGLYSDKEIDLCRKWMSEQTKWNIIR